MISPLNFLIIRLFMLMIFLIVVALITLVAVTNRRKNVIAAENNALAIGITEVRIEKSEIINRFYDYQMDAFLRRIYPGLRSWNPVHEERVGFHWEGLHVMTCHMLDGNRFNVSVFVRPDHITPELYHQPEEQQAEAASYEDIAAVWMGEWNQELATHATQGTGFAIPLEQLPQEEEAQELIIDLIISQGDFSVQRDEENGCLRLACSMAAM